ncbi:copper resistance CopC/CopD family protein [Streptomyces sp. NPDC020681]|uniref:copper resistance CopC/CopD family protein n=1 Tax=Streptomyces sp. NPDC020681 TaxID=3365083 RepID=UPI00378CDA7B
MRRRALSAGIGAVVALLLLAPNASAHTELASSSPKNGAQLARAPHAVVLTFTETVDPADVHVTSEGKRLTVQRAATGKPTAVTVGIPEPKTRTGAGSLNLDWQVRDSSDGHASSGSLSFRIRAAAGADTAPGDSGKPSADTGRETAATSDRPVHLAWAAARWSGNLALALFVGGLAFLAMLWPQGSNDRRTRRILAAAWACGLAATVAGAGLQGAYGAFGSLGDTLEVSTYQQLLDSEVGIVLACRALMWVLAAVVLTALLQGGQRTARSPGWRVGAAVVCFGLLRTTGMAGHNSEGDHPGWGAAADMVHLLGVSLWLGGLTLLLLGVLPRRHPTELSAAVSGYSTLAGLSVAAIAVAGTVLAWQVVGSFDALLGTAYGRLLLLKLALLAAVLLIAQLSRRWVRTRLDIAVLLRGDRATVRPFVYSVAAETGLVIAVLAATSLLVTANPGR